MPASNFLDVEAKLCEDTDGSYKEKLIQFLETRRDEFALSKQRLLPPEEYLVADSMEEAAKAALAFLSEIQK